ncbi:MAG: hypothetical protein IPO27_05595 [Bacteroidetes bacterium]|nr:hypothetical protein [Bacteroidota bacterium]
MRLLLIFSISIILLQSCKPKPTFVDIAPIIYKNCSGCHRPGQSGPMSLLSYTDCKKVAHTIKYTTESRQMPPWPADVNYVQFLDEKFLTDAEIKLISDWAENGALEGDKEKTPKAPSFPDSSEIGIPDLRIPCEPFLIKGDKREKFIMMKVPFTLENDTNIRCIEFVAGNKKLIHHMNGHMITFDKREPALLYAPPFIVDRDTAYEISESAHNLHLLADDGSYPTMYGSVSNYLPGTGTMIYPNGIGGWRIHKNSALLLRDIHYGATTIDQWDSSYFNLFFAKEKPVRPTLEIQLGTLGISKIEPPLIIPPDKITTYRTQATVPVAISILTINPHMHLIGKSFWAYALTPQQDTIRIVRINKWDFRWQYFYTYPKPIIIPAGSTIYVEGSFDNTDKNPNNPNNPPIIIREPVGGNMRTTDEMFQLIITYLPYQKGDEKIDLSKNTID